MEQTPQIIRRTHIFDPVDNIYGESGADYQTNGDPNGEGGGPMGGGPMGGGPAAGFGDGFDDFGGTEGDGLGDLGEPGAESEGSISGAPDETDLGNMPLQEDSIKTEDVLLSESLSLNKKINDIVKDLDDTISKKE